ncbi:Holliday junction branch migration protein RuvA [Propioniciclava tarda]|uniref:Holliday junction branch migration complex subunit RuvA n=1 Tax=Propioniciclava tarda TaxID=433330 RepID=A0A4Q9KN28_PROTD|nr:Holliday junction branch migration protein RuvA [Propioniciclava tarda]TBT95844.1 Holliday junction branch migration protein RuvA [Propioniciclava tarda]SMO40458.1 Holliday junction DNA helicase subunit RuvA [Propioniciclava tarda]
MIAQITGNVVSAGPTWIVVELGGLGLRALTTPSTSAGARPGQPVTLQTSLVVREDSLTLYAFADADERDAFELVQSASGIGPKIALATVSVLPPDALRTAISTANLVALMKVPGIGKKGAERLVIELRDKVAGLGSGAEPAAQAAPAASGWQDQVASGLETLGWSARDAAAAVERIAPLAAEDPTLGVGALMRAALRTLAKG